jgi:hypothetical protein
MSGPSLRKGQNACKGQGFMNLTEKACVERLGRT